MTTVRSLDWETVDDDHEAAKCDATGLGYEVRTTPRGLVRVRFPNADWDYFDGTRDQATEAAQADYERRILECLDAP